MGRRLFEQVFSMIYRVHVHYEVMIEHVKVGLSFKRC